jgi:hypothetical protein
MAEVSVRVLRRESAVFNVLIALKGMTALQAVRHLADRPSLTNNAAWRDLWNGIMQGRATLVA